MAITIALAGNPNCGKTTLFNALTGSNQFVGNWPGVTVEKKEGKLKGNKEVSIMDLPGIYSLSPYTLEEVVTRNYLINEKPDALINIVDGTNLERNLYLTTQLIELGIPMVMAINMMDIVRKNGDVIHTDKLSQQLGCEVVEISALKGSGIDEVTQKAIQLAENKKLVARVHHFAPEVEEVLSKIQEQLGSEVADAQKRFFAIKLLERDEKIDTQLSKVPDVTQEIEHLENIMDDDTESIITNERYVYISSIINGCQTKKNRTGLTTSDKIDQIVTNRFLALPIFALIMFVVYYISVSTIGTLVTDWANDGVFGEGWQLFGMEIPGIPVVLEAGLDSIGCADWLKGLILDGIVGGVGAVLGFVPQMLILFMFLAFLESCGYMARVAFIMDRIFRKFGLSGKSFIPMLVGTGCGVPGVMASRTIESERDRARVAFIMDRIFRKFGLSGKSFIPMLVGTGCGVPGVMASRTIESERDRRMTVMTTTFIPCGAKLPIIALIAGALFGGAWWVAPSAYFVGIAAIIISGIILKKTRLFTGDVAPFVMELPAYHLPTVGNVLRSMWERGWSFIKKAGTVILLSTTLVWFMSNFGIVDGQFTMVEDLKDGFLASIGKVIAPIFAPLGWGEWKSAVATITGLIAKENVVGTFGVLFGFAEVAEDGTEIWGTLASQMTPLSAYSFLVFNLLCAPCFAAIGAIKREMNNAKWFWFAIGYQTIFAYLVALCIFQIGSLVLTGSFAIGTFVAILVIIAFIYLLVRPDQKFTSLKGQKMSS